MSGSAEITSPLNDAERDTALRVLQSTLVDLVDLHLVGKQAHWNVVGEKFRDVHRQLDELVTAARGFADEVAERAVTIGGSPDGRASTVAGNSELASLEAGWKGDREVIEVVVTSLAGMISRLRERIDETGKADPVTQDLLIRISGEIEKSHWMWQAQLAG
ncbi:Dps family protein [Salinifilum ghardaiensis]